MLTHFEPVLRTPDEQAAWQAIVKDSARAARIRAAQLFIQLISTMDDPAGNVCWSNKSAEDSALCARAYSTTRSKQRADGVDDAVLDREWVVDSGCYHHSIGIHRLTQA